MCALIRKHNIIIASYQDSMDDYGNPIYIINHTLKNVTLNSLSGNTDMQMFGDKITRMCKTLVDYDEWLGLLNEKDLAYLYGANPMNEVSVGDDANYMITAVLPQNKKIAVYFERLVGK